MSCSLHQKHENTSVNIFGVSIQYIVSVTNTIYMQILVTHSSQKAYRGSLAQSVPRPLRNLETQVRTPQRAAFLFFADYIHPTALMQKKNSSGIEPAPPDQKPGALTTTPGNHHLMFLTPCYNNFIYVYKYACLVKLKYLEYQVNWTCTRPYFKSIPQPFAIQ